MLNRINVLLERAKLVEDAPSLPKEEIEYAEKKLGVTFPEDFKEISSHYRYDYLGGFEFFNWLPDKKSSVVEQTKGYRESLNLPPQYVALEEYEPGIILFKTPTTEDPSSSVIWCDYEDLYNICAGRPFTANPTIFPSFTDFFEFLIKREEEDRELESSLL